MIDDVQGLERGKWGWKWEMEMCGERVKEEERERDVIYSYLLVQHTQIYYFDEKADRTSTYPDGIRAEFARGGRVRFWRVGCPFDVMMMMDNLFACSGLFDRLIDGEREKKKRGETKNGKRPKPEKEKGVLGRQACSTTEARRGEES